MIRSQEIEPVGRLIKPHGIKGELNALWTCDVAPGDLRCLVLPIDGIFVPFFLKGWRPRGSESYLLSFDGIDDEQQASALAGIEIYALREDLPEEENGPDDDDDGLYASDLVGYALIANGSPLGTVEDYDDSTANLLLLVTRPDGATVYIPAAGEFITDIDPDKQELHMELPDELITLNS